MNFSAFAWGRFKFKAAASQRGAFLHAQEPEAGAAHGLIPQGRRIKTDTVVADVEVELGAGGGQFN